MEELSGKCQLILVLTATLAGCGQQGGSAGGKPAGAAPDIQWGEPVNGLQAGIALKSATQGTPPQFTLELFLLNTGSKPVRILKLAKKYYHPVFALEVTSQGTICKHVGSKPTPPMAPTAADFLDLGPGAVDSAVIAMDPRDWGLEPPFTALIAFVHKDGVGLKELARSQQVEIKAGKPDAIRAPALHSGLPEAFAERFDRLFLSTEPVRYQDNVKLLAAVDVKKLNLSETGLLRSKLRSFLTSDQSTRKYAPDSEQTGRAPPLAFLRVKAIGLLGQVGTREDVGFLRGLDAKASGYPPDDFTRACGEAVGAIEDRHKSSSAEISSRHVAIGANGVTIYLAIYGTPETVPLDLIGTTRTDIETRLGPPYPVAKRYVTGDGTYKEIHDTYDARWYVT